MHSNCLLSFVFFMNVQLLRHRHKQRDVRYSPIPAHIATVSKIHHLAWNVTKTFGVVLQTNCKPKNDSQLSVATDATCLDKESRDGR